jgi:hypothetical protein
MASWNTIQPGIPDFLTDVVQTIQGLLNALISILNILLAILSVVKAFIAGLLNPLLAIINAIIAEIEGLLNDLRQIGIYIAGDTELKPPDFSGIIGGFSAYERRMIGRLVNRADPTRPDFSSRSAVIAIFLYVGVDTSGVGQLVSIIQRILAFFGRKTDIAVTSVPVALEATYGEEGALLSAFGPMTEALRKGGVPNQANVRWLMSPSSQPTGLLQPGPKGFLVEVSTVPDGLLLAYDTYAKNALVGGKPAKRVYGLARDPKTGLPFRLYGGADMIDVSDLENPTFKADTDGTDRSTKLYGYQSAADNIPIPLDLLKDGGDHILQRTFFVKSGFLNVAKPGQGFALTLSSDEMPFNADFEVGGNGKVTVTKLERADTVYVRISQVTEEIADIVVTAAGTGKTGALTTELNFYRTSSADVIEATQGATATGSYTIGTSNIPELGPSHKGQPSQPLIVTFPGTSTANYIETLTAALVVLVLGRTDLPVADEADEFLVGKAATETGLEEISRFLVPFLIKEGKQGYFKRKNVSPEDFRRQLLKRARGLANVMYNRTGPLGSIEDTVVEAGAALLEFKWSDADSNYPDLTILESLESSDLPEGLGLNPLSVGTNSIASAYLKGLASVTRAPAFLEKANTLSAGWMYGGGSADDSPVVYNLGALIGLTSAGTRVAFCRNAMTSDVYGAAASVLQVSSAVMTLSKNSKTGSWTTIRLFPQGLPPVEAALDEIIKWVKAIAAGIQGFADIIIAYIEFLQARLLELQALIVRINAMLSALTGFSLPSMSGLVVTGNGTDGILAELITAENKPTDNSQSTTGTSLGNEKKIYGTYGGGVVLLAGGLPTVLIEILQAFFPEAE